MDKYRIIEHISSTDNSDVNLVINNVNKQVYIMKKIKNGSIIPYEIMQGEHNNNLVDVYEIFEDEQTVILEYVQGIPLSQISKAMNESEVRRIAMQLCNAIKELHKNNIIHRDIKPSNIMINADGNIKLIDFDIARTYKEYRGKDTRYIGTDGFAPPEQYGFAQTDIRTDIYAIGAVMYELLTNGQPLQTLISYSGELKEVILKCTQLNPDDRYQSVNELADALLKKPAKKSKTTVKRIFDRRILLIIPIIAVIALITFFCISSANKPDNYQSNSTEESINIDNGIYNENTSPVGVSSIKLGKRHLPTGRDALIVYAKVTNNGADNDFTLVFELLDKNNNSLGTVRVKDNFGGKSFTNIDEFVTSVTNSSGEYIHNGEAIHTIRLAEVNQS